MKSQALGSLYHKQITEIPFMVCDMQMRFPNLTILNKPRIKNQDQTLTFSFGLIGEEAIRLPAPVYMLGE